MVIFDDDEIRRLIDMPKVWGRSGDLPSLRRKRGHLESEARLTADGGLVFRVLLRRGADNKASFSAILMVQVPDSTRWFRLLRYNGSHWHRNRIEGNRFRGFHIHTATERYQAANHDEDGYAELTDRYAGYQDAVRCLKKDANLPVASLGDPNQIRLGGPFA